MLLDSNYSPLMQIGTACLDHTPDIAGQESLGRLVALGQKGEKKTSNASKLLRQALSKTTIKREGESLGIDCPLSFQKVCHMINGWKQ